MTRNLLVYFDGTPVMVRTRDNYFFSSSFTIGHRVYLKYAFRDSPEKLKSTYLTFCHEVRHVLQYRDAKGDGRVEVATFLFSYLGKKLLRILLPKAWEPSDMYENEAHDEEDVIAAGLHARIQIPPETRNHFV